MKIKSKKSLLKIFGIVCAIAVVSVVSGFKLANRTAYAAPSSYLNFQGRILNSSGGLVPDGYYNIQFKLYSASSGGSALWTESYYDSNGVTAGNDNRLRVVNGYFSANLGSQTAFSGINWDQQMWLTMNIGGSTQTATPTYDGEMNPRIQLTAVPLAFVANNVNSGDTSTSSTNSNAVSIKSGNATGATSNSGNITIDVGTATGTAGTISIGTANTTGITIGRVGVSTTINNALSVVGSLGTISTSTTGNNLNFSRAGANYITATDVSGSLGLGVAGSLSAIGIASNGSLSFAGASTFSSSITGDTVTVGTTTGGGSLVLKPGSADHAYIQFFADTAAPNTRSGYLGYTASGSTTLTFANEIGDQINLGVGTDDVTVSDQLTVTGNSSVGGTLGVTGSLQVAGGYQTYYGQSYSVPTATNVNINLTSTATTLVDGMQYRVMLSTTGTGTSNGAVYIIYETASNVWASRLVSAAGTNSNHPLLGISGSNVYVYHNHASTYNIRTQVYGYSSGNAFTNSSYFGLDGAMTNLGGNIGIGNSNPTSLLSVGSSSEFQVNSSGAIAAVTGITSSGGYTQTGTGSNTFSGVTNLTASGTALSVTNNASIGGTLAVTGLITANGGINVASSAGYYYGGTSSPMNLELTRALPTAVNDFVEIGNFFMLNGAHVVRLSTTVSVAGNSVAKTYEIPIKWNATSNTWFTVAPSYDTGAWSGNNYDIDVLVNNNTASFRVRRTSGTSAADIKIRVESLGATTDAFTATTATGSTTAPTSVYGRIYQDVLGNVGIGTTAPTTALQVVGSGYFGSTGNTTLSVDRGAITNTGLFQYYTGGAFRWGAGLISNSTDDYAISTDGTAAGAKLYIQRSTGNIGIGTSNPINGALEVQGGSNVSAYFQTSNDSTITLRGTNTWAGITFLDTNGLDRLWFNGSNGSFSVGGGGSSSGTKKLHVDGGVTIGTNLDNSSAPTNGILIEGSYTQTGTDANTLSGATSLTAAGTALSVTNSATIGGRLGVGIAAPTSNVFLEVNGSTLTRGADVRTDTTGVYTYEGVARFRNNTGDLDGALVLGVPDGGNTMLKIRISGYNYGTEGGWEVIASGYHYNTGGSWINTSTEIRGQAPFSRVRFMMESGAPRIVLGDAADLNNWDYPNVTVDVDIAGYTNTDLYYSGWSLGLDTALTGFAAVTEPTIRQTAYTSNVFLQGGNSFGTTAILGTNDAQSLAFETNGTTKLTISTTGVASLTGSLVVTGTEGVKLIGTGTTGIASMGYQGFYDSNGTTRYGYIGDASVSDTDIYVVADSGNQLKLGSSGVTRLTLDTSGNATFSGTATINGAGTGLSVTNNARILGTLAVGPNAASDNLTINGGLGVDLSFGIRAQTAGGASTRSIFTQGAATGALTLAVDPGGNGSARNFTLNVGVTSNVIYANGSGSVGIGTATPATRLSVVGGDFLVNNNGLGDANSGIRIVSNVATTHYNWRIGAQAAIGGLEFTPSTTTGGTTFTNPALVILSSNSNVGIGDTSPASLFTVGATDAFQVNNDGMVMLGNSGDPFGNSYIGFANGATLSAASIAYGINGEAYNSSTGNVTGINLLAGSSYAGSLSYLRGGQLGVRTLNASTSVTNGYALFLNNSTITAGSITNSYGLFVQDQTGATNDYGIAIEGADTQALWIGSGANNTDAANGIAFGSSRDTNLYRSAVDTLRTDDALSVGGALTVSGATTLSSTLAVTGNATFSGNLTVSGAITGSISDPNGLGDNLLRNGNFESGSQNWSLFSGVLGSSIANSTSPVGGRSYRSTGNTTWLISDDYIPVDSNKTYRLEGWAKETIDEGKGLYLGLAYYNASKSLINVANCTSYSYIAAANYALDSNWRYFAGEVGGGEQSSSPYSCPAGNQGSLDGRPGTASYSKFIPGTRYVRAIIGLNHNTATTSEQEITGIRFTATNTQHVNSFISPDVDDSYSLGTASYRFNNIQIGTGTSSIAGNFTVSGGTLLMNNATSNLIDLSANGLGAPTTTTRSAGTKLVLWNGLSGSTTDYGIGIESGALWNSVTSSSAQFKWYAGTSQVASISGVGTADFAGGISAGTGDAFSVATTGALSLSASGTGLSVTNNATIGGTLALGSGASMTVPDGAGTTFTPQLSNVLSSGVAGIGVGINDGTNNRRAGLFVDQTNAIWGLTSTFSSGAIPFVVRQASSEWLRIDISGNADVMGGLTAGSGNAFNVNSSGAITASTGIATSGAYTQTGTGANTFSGASSFTASGTALSVTNDAAVAGSVVVGATPSSSVALLVNKSVSGTSGTVSALSVSSAITATGVAGLGVSLSPTVSSDTTGTTGIRMVPTIDPTTAVTQVIGINNNWNLGKTTGTNTNAVTTAIGQFIRNTIGAGYSGTVTSLYGIQLPDSVNTTATLTRQAGIALGQQTGATNNTNLLIGTTAIPSGDYSIYNSSTRSNYFAGALTLDASSTGLTVTNNTTLGGTLGVAGTSTLVAINASGAYTQTGTGANTFSGATSFTASGTALSVTNSASIGGTLAVGGAVTGGTYNGQTISSAANFTGTATFGGALTVYTSSANSDIVGVIDGNDLDIASYGGVAINLDVNQASVGNSSAFTIYNGTGTSIFSLPESGALTVSGDINGQTISSAANFTGTVAISGQISLSSSTANDLYFTPDGLFDISSNGNVAINLDVNASSGVTGVFAVKDDTGANVFEVDETGAADINGDLTLNFGGTATTNGVCHSGANSATTATNRSLVVCSGAPSDYAEFYPAENGVEAGDIVATSSNMLTYQGSGADPETGIVVPQGTKQISIVKKAANNDSAFGIVSTAPYQVIGRDVPVTANRKPIALNGRVPVKVNNEGGSISIGDRIAVSSVAGYGKKSTEAGFTVGIALEPFNGTSGQIMVYVQNTYYNPPTSTANLLNGGTINGNLAINGSLNVSGPTTLSSLNVTGNVNISGNLTVVGNISTKNISVSGKIITNGDAPTFALGADAKGKDAVVTVVGNDISGSITYDSGTVDMPANFMNAGQQINVTFHESYTSVPKLALTAKNANSAGVKFFVETTVTGFTVHFLDTPSASTQYLFDYIIVQ